MASKVSCISCGRNISVIPNTVQFSCPGCLKEKIVRCGKCRAMAVKYTCKCGFTGP